MRVELRGFDPSAARLDIVGAPPIELRHVASLMWSDPSGAPTPGAVTTRRRVHVLGGATYNVRLASQSDGEKGHFG